MVGESDDIAGVALGVSDNVAVRTQAYWSFFRGGPWPVLKSDVVSGSVLGGFRTFAGTCLDEDVAPISDVRLRDGSPLERSVQAGAGLAMRNLTPIPSTIAPPTAATPMQKTPTSGKPPAARTNPPADAPRTMPS